MSVARPSVSVVMPFAGSRPEAEMALDAVLTLRLRPTDQLVIVDNNASPVIPNRPGIRIVHAAAEQSPCHARNVGAAEATGEWVLFLDADCRPPADLLDAYFATRPSTNDGILAGEVEGDPSQRSLLARYARSRGYLRQAPLLADSFRPHAVTANLLVRRAAWEAVGGFAEGIRSGEDSDFCWRVQGAGWRITARPDARVVHGHRETLGPFLRAVAGYAAGRAWLKRRYPGSFASRPGATDALRAAASSLLWLSTGARERGAFRGLDAVVGLADLIGEQLSNRVSPCGRSAGADVVFVVDTHPEPGSVATRTAVAECAQGRTVRLEARRRPQQQDLSALRVAPVCYDEDCGRLEKCWNVARLLTLHPVRLTSERARRDRDSGLAVHVLAGPVARLDHDRHAVVRAEAPDRPASIASRVAAICGRPYDAALCGRA